MRFVWTDDFQKFKKKVEGVFGNIDELVKTDPDIYAHMVLAHGFMEFVGCRAVRPTRQLYDIWVKENGLGSLPAELIDAGWSEFLED